MYDIASLWSWSQKSSSDFPDKDGGCPCSYNALFLSMAVCSTVETKQQKQLLYIILHCPMHNYCNTHKSLLIFNSAQLQDFANFLSSHHVVELLVCSECSYSHRLCLLPTLTQLSVIVYNITSLYN